MADAKKFSMAELVNEPYCPEGWEDLEAEYVKLEDIIDQEIGIMKFMFNISKNTEKYNQGNEKAVHFVFMDKDENVKRTATHAKRIVRGFEQLEKAAAKTDFSDFPVLTKIVKTTLDNGRTMYDFKF